jgi:hypothetical protein
MHDEVWAADSYQYFRKSLLFTASGLRQIVRENKMYIGEKEG